MADNDTELDEFLSLTASSPAKPKFSTTEWTVEPRCMACGMRWDYEIGRGCAGCGGSHFTEAKPL